MTTFGSFAGRRAADELARLLDARGGLGTPAGPEVALAYRLRSVGAALDPLPRPDFRAALRQRLEAVATVQAAQAAEAVSRPAVAQVRRTPRGLGLAAGAMASVVAATGVAVASSRSLPGDPFYSVKRQSEALQLWFASDGVAQGTDHLQFAATRLREVKGLTFGHQVLTFPRFAGGTALLAAGLQGASALGAQDDARVRATLADMDRETREGTALLTVAYRSTRSADPLRILTAFADRQSHGIEAILPSLPAASRDRAQASLSLVTQVGQQAGALLSLGNCTAACNPQAAAPVLPTSAPAGPTPVPSSSDAPCTCPTEAPAPSVTPTPAPEPPTPGPTPSERPTPQPTPTPSRTPSPSPSEQPLPLPPLPVPTPTLPVPLPSTPAPLPLPLPTLPVSPWPLLPAPAPAPLP